MTGAELAATLALALVGFLALLALADFVDWLAMEFRIWLIRRRANKVLRDAGIDERI